MRNLETIFGEQLVDPESRFSTGAVLRAMQCAPATATRRTERRGADHDPSTYLTWSQLTYG